ncbi:SDR family oxidoreductase [Catenuloplanes japonicus]|uniref:SDR family oxidoreductase n=1 Tax=Catenuloplanes japonicus TaxID=33876 RepID=UPI0005243CB7|nr:NAD(P)H-binding protein [Catenuloplanes japonicus]
MKILITGATGNVGGHVARLLAATDHELVALVRDPDTANLPANVTTIKGDLTDPEGVRDALHGVDRVFLNMADDNGAAFARVVAGTGVNHVVLLSSFTATTALPSGDANIITARHQAGERALTESGVPSTFLRAAGFMLNVRGWLPESGDGEVLAPNVDVRLPVVDPADIAAAAVAVLTAADPAPAAYSITGPAPLSVRDQIAVINETLGRDHTVREITEAGAVAAVFPPGTPDFVSRSILETQGPAASVLPPSGDVETLTGRPAHTFTEWVTANLA